jgi:hypothetical protein
MIVRNDHDISFARLVSVVKDSTKSEKLYRPGKNLVIPKRTGYVFIFKAQQTKYIWHIHCL